MIKLNIVFNLSIKLIKIFTLFSFFYKVLNGGKDNLLFRQDSRYRKVT